MEALYLLIPLSIVAVFAAAWIFLRMSDSGQFEDLDGPAWSVLHDDDRPAGAASAEDPADDDSRGENRNAAPAYRGENRNLTDNRGSVRIDAAQDRRVTTSR